MHIKQWIIFTNPMPEAFLNLFSMFQIALIELTALSIYKINSIRYARRFWYPRFVCTQIHRRTHNKRKLVLIQHHRGQERKRNMLYGYMLIWCQFLMLRMLNKLRINVCTHKVQSQTSSFEYLKMRHGIWP